MCCMQIWIHTNMRFFKLKCGTAATAFVWNLSVNTGHCRCVRLSCKLKYITHISMNSYLHTTHRCMRLRVPDPFYLIQWFCFTCSMKFNVGSVRYIIIIFCELFRLSRNRIKSFWSLPFIDSRFLPNQNIKMSILIGTW